MKLFTALMFTAVASFSFAQNAPTPPGFPPVNAQPYGVSATPAPVPTAAPVVGMNIDTTSQPATGALPPEEVQRRMQEAATQAATQNQMRARAASMKTSNGTTPFNPSSNQESPEQKSEIVAVLPPAERPPELRAVLRTSVGDITIRLDRVNAPHSVEYFSGIAKGDVSFTDIKTSKPVKRPFYNGLIFHRVVKNTMIQTGDPFANGRGNSGQTIQDEIKSTMKFDRPGLVALAPMRDSTGTKISKNSNSSQFFITLREMPEWNGEFTIIGEVEDGLDVVQKIANAKVGPTERPIKRIYLVAVDILDVAK